MTFTVIIPVYNEVKTIQEIIRRVQATGLVDEILVVDDGSQDGTRELLNNLTTLQGLKVIFHERNKGKGAAVGFAKTDPGRNCGCGVWLAVFRRCPPTDIILEYGGE